MSEVGAPMKERGLVSRAADGARREVRRIDDRMHAIGETGTRSHILGVAASPAVRLRFPIQPEYGPASPVGLECRCSPERGSR